MQLIEQVTLMMFSLLQGKISPQLGNIHVSNHIQRLKMLFHFPLQGQRYRLW